MRADEAAAVSVAQEEAKAAEAAAIAEQRSWIEAAIAEGRAETVAGAAAVEWQVSQRQQRRQPDSSRTVASPGGGRDNKQCISRSSNGRGGSTGQ